MFEFTLEIRIRLFLMPFYYLFRGKNTSENETYPYKTNSKRFIQN